MHVSQAYDNEDSTITFYTFSFLVTQIPLLFQTLSRGRPKVELALAMHELTSSSIFADLSGKYAAEVSIFPSEVESSHGPSRQNSEFCHADFWPVRRLGSS